MEYIEYGKNDALPIRYINNVLCVYYNPNQGYYLINKLRIYYDDQLRFFR